LCRPGVLQSTRLWYGRGDGLIGNIPIKNRSVRCFPAQKDMHTTQHFHHINIYTRTTRQLDRALFLTGLTCGSWCPAGTSQQVAPVTLCFLRHSPCSLWHQQRHVCCHFHSTRRRLLQHEWCLGGGPCSGGVSRQKRRQSRALRRWRGRRWADWCL
jgi:hypothetical protein